MTLIEKLEEYHQSLYERWYDNHKHPYDEGAMDAVEKAINIVKQHSDWVSVKEIPAQRGRYLVYTTDGSVFDCRYSQDCWHKDTIGYRDILYWMPLPQPPSEVQDD